MRKLIIISTHPIQYNAPLFKLLSKRNNIMVKVLYTWGQSKEGKYDSGFKKLVNWDIPLLEGYPYDFIQNVSPSPGSNHFLGILNIGLISKIKEHQPDAILIYGWSFFSHLFAMIKFKNKCKILFRGDSTILDESNSVSMKKLLRRLYLKQVYRFIDLAFYAGSANKIYFESHGVNQEKLIFSPHSIDNLRFGDSNDFFRNKSDKWKKSLGIQDKLVFMFVGKFETKKNPLLLIEAFIKNTNNNIALLLVGSGHLEGELKLRTKNIENIIFIPFQNQSAMPIVYRLADVLVLPSSGPGETWGLVVNESFACGVPAIVSNKVGCSYDLIYPKETGWVFESGKSEDLSKCMNEAISLGKAGLSKMGFTAQALIQKWNFEENARILEEVIMDC